MVKSKLNPFISLRPPAALYTSPKMATLPPHLRMTSPAHKENKVEPSPSTDEQPSKLEEQTPKRYDNPRKSCSRKSMTPKQRKRYDEDKQANLEQQYAHSELLRQNCGVRDFQIEADAHEANPEVQRRRLIQTQGHSNEELAAEDVKNRDFQAEATGREICELGAMMLKKLDVRERAVYMLEHLEVLRSYVERSEDFPGDENMIEETIKRFVMEQIASKREEEETLVLAEEAEKMVEELERLGKKARGEAKELGREVTEVNKGGKKDSEREDEGGKDENVARTTDRSDAQDSPVGKGIRRSAGVGMEGIEESSNENEPKANIGKPLCPARTVQPARGLAGETRIWRLRESPKNEQDLSIDEQVAASIDQEIVSGIFQPATAETRLQIVADREEAGWEEWVEHAESA